jgi:hypothetical protein
MLLQIQCFIVEQYVNIQIGTTYCKYKKKYIMQETYVFFLNFVFVDRKRSKSEKLKIFLYTFI